MLCLNRVRALCDKHTCTYTYTYIYLGGRHDVDSLSCVNSANETLAMMQSVITKTMATRWCAISTHIRTLASCFHLSARKYLNRYDDADGLAKDDLGCVLPCRCDDARKCAVLNNVVFGRLRMRIFEKSNVCACRLSKNDELRVCVCVCLFKPHIIQFPDTLYIYTMCIRISLSRWCSLDLINAVWGLLVFAWAFTAEPKKKTLHKDHTTFSALSTRFNDNLKCHYAAAHARCTPVVRRNDFRARHQNRRTSLMNMYYGRDADSDVIFQSASDATDFHRRTDSCI